MKRQVLIYFLGTLVFLLLITLARGWFSPLFIPFWVGGLLGALLPDADHFIYIYFLKPHELTSQRAVRMISKGEVMSTLSLLVTTRSERKGLIFHTTLFQIVFYVFAFLVLSSTDSFLGRGIVLSFLLHLLIDQYIDFQELGSISNWFRNLNITLTRDKTVFYWTAMGLLLVAYGFIF